MAKKEGERPVVRIKRFQIGVNVLLQLLLLVVLLGMINYLAFRHYKRWDLSRNKKHALSEQTVNVLQALEDKVKFVVFFSPGAPGAEIFSDLENLLKEYQYAGGGKVDVEYIDPFRNFSRARELQGQYKFGATENLVILDYKGRSKFVNATDMAEFDGGQPMFGQPPRLKAFKGEQALTSAVLEVTEEKQSKIAFVTGHGELEIGSGGPLAGLAQYIERQNAKAEPLNFSNLDQIPDDVTMLVVVGAKYDFSEREMEILRKYWENKGRIFIALNPSADTPRLDAFLAQAGIRANDDRVMRTVALMPGMIGVLKDVSATFEAGSPVTKALAGVESLLLGGTQSLTLEEDLARRLDMRVQRLMTSSEGFWGEVDHRGGPDTPVHFDPDRDHAGPLVLAASVERGGVGDPTVKVDSSRMIVVGNFGFITDEALTQPNLDFFLGGMNWMMGRESLIAIAPKTVETFSLNLTEQQIGRIAQICMIYIPLGVAFLGVIVWTARRR
jgi:hypothetical protein